LVKIIPYPFLTDAVSSLQRQLTEACESLALKEKDAKELADQLSQKSDELLLVHKEVLMVRENCKQAEQTVQTLQQTIVELQTSEVCNAYAYNTILV
jgi:septal ring factor EnvC (AmiA/AmiB activator)